MKHGSCHKSILLFAFAPGVRWVFLWVVEGRFETHRCKGLAVVQGAGVA